MAVVTVGYIRAGTKNNIIPDKAELGLTVRTYKDNVRKQVLAAITRIAKAESVAGGAPQEPLIEHYEFDRFGLQRPRTRRSGSGCRSKPRSAKRM